MCECTREPATRQRPAPRAAARAARPRRRRRPARLQLTSKPLALRPRPPSRSGSPRGPRRARRRREAPAPSARPSPPPVPPRLALRARRAGRPWLRRTFAKHFLFDVPLAHAHGAGAGGRGSGLRRLGVRRGRVLLLLEWPHGADPPPGEGGRWGPGLDAVTKAQLLPPPQPPEQTKGGCSSRGAVRCRAESGVLARVGRNPDGRADGRRQQTRPVSVKQRTARSAAHRAASQTEPATPTRQAFQSAVTGRRATRAGRQQFFSGRMTGRRRARSER